MSIRRLYRDPEIRQELLQPFSPAGFHWGNMRTKSMAIPRKVFDVDCVNQAVGYPADDLAGGLLQHGRSRSGNRQGWIGCSGAFRQTGRRPRSAAYPSWRLGLGDASPQIGTVPAASNPIRCRALRCAVV